jgi:GNAT superfamily N-acetyltransferase
VRIRPANPGDLDELVAVHLASFRGGNGPHLAAERMAELTPARDAEAWEPVLRDTPERARLVVLEDGGELRGVAGAGPARDDDLDRSSTGELSALYVHPDAWGRGYGDALHAAALGHLQAERFTAAVLWVLEGNQRARRFYADRGWREDGARGAFWESPKVRLHTVLGR